MTESFTSDTPAGDSSGEPSSEEPGRRRNLRRILLAGAVALLIAGGGGVALASVDSSGQQGAPGGAVLRGPLPQPGGQQQGPGQPGADGGACGAPAAES